MTKITQYRGHQLTLSDDIEGARQATYEINNEGAVQVECPDIDDLTRIAMRVIDERLDPSYQRSKLADLMRMALPEDQPGGYFDFTSYMPPATESPGPSDSGFSGGGGDSGGGGASGNW